MCAFPAQSQAEQGTDRLRSFLVDRVFKERLAQREPALYLAHIGTGL